MTTELARVQRVSEVRLDVRHALWTPVSVGGETPELLGGATTPARNGWQPLGVGTADYKQTAGAGTRTFRSDAGLMIKLSGGQTGDLIEDHTGDGDGGVVNRSHHFEQPANRTLEFDATKHGRWMERFVYTVFDDPSKRALDLRETFTDRDALGAVMVNGAGEVGDRAITVDGAAAGDLAVDDLITLAGNATVYRVITVNGATIGLDKGLVAAAADNAAVSRAAQRRNIVWPYLIEEITDKREAKGVLGMTLNLKPQQPPTRTGMGA